MLENIKACLFDLDGTVIDSMWLWKSVDEEYLARFGLTVPEKLKTDIEGKSMNETAEYFKSEFGIKDDIKKIVSDWNDMALYKYANEVPLKDGFLKFFKYLKENNIKVGICTSNSLVLTEAALNAHGILGDFDAITTGCTDIKGKPEPDVYLQTAEKLNVKPSECIVFEDLCVGIQAGIAAGMKTVAVRDKFSEDQWERKVKMADYNIEDYNEVFKG